ncbi:dethiobiotin synthase [Robiginitalea sp.]|nr:dethiobiotin synthase [Robiginitalea sp.]
MKARVFVTGISTEVGKTLASAILTESLEADYWKPIQSGDLQYTDSDKVRELITNTTSQIHPSAYSLQTPMSPHAAAEIDGVTITLDKIIPPQTKNHLVIEGAGGLMVPLNNQDTIADLILDSYRVVVVSRHYLGSINHTLLTLQALKEMGFAPVIVFSGNPHPTTESIIASKSQVPILGRIPELSEINSKTVYSLAEELRPALVRYLLT